MRIIDLSHEIGAGFAAYPGLPAPVIDDYLGWEDSHRTYCPGTEFRIGRITMVGNTGTYLDTPAHRYRDGFDLGALPLEAVVERPGLLVRTGARAICAEAFDGLPVRGRAVLVDTGWCRHWRTARYGDAGHPHLTAGAAALLAERGAGLVGIDSVNIDDTSPRSAGRRPAHSALLAAGIPIVEHLCGLDELHDGPFTFTAVPVKVSGLATFPVRAYARQRPI
ncbi:cyclase family protein [Actinomadura parmotrematis]|uniref:Cyclase family protein n=1 Tax=Actinomadura parmotrematis TaxID=2864039 RepID=A0ABS7G2V2_9ACTN|nr:cyclase family protein [Actinomadura parmotrematis]MBW8486806.1 cyclase family protein [Actinomadura parmotrematis]